MLRLAAEGYSNAEIADLLVVAESTAKTHVKRVLAKIDARDRAQAVVIAYQSGLMAGRTDRCLPRGGRRRAGLPPRAKDLHEATTLDAAVEAEGVGQGLGLVR